MDIKEKNRILFSPYSIKVSSYLVELIWWCRDSRLEEAAGQRRGCFHLHEWLHCLSWSPPPWPGWEHAGRNKTTNRTVGKQTEWEQTLDIKLLANPHANAAQMVRLTSQLSSRKTASCASLLCSWLMYLMGLIRASAYSDQTQRPLNQCKDFAAWCGCFLLR